MAKTKTSTASGESRLVGLSGPRSPFQLVETAGDPQAKPAAAQPVAPDPNDPSGVKSYIAFSVAHGIYPKGAGIDPDQDISDDVGLNAGTIAAEINFDAQHLATIHQLNWKSVSADDVSKLKTVSDLVNLVKTNLSDTANTGGGGK